MFMHPVPGPITSRFGPRPPLLPHNGLDHGFLEADPETSQRVFALADGVVEEVGWHFLVGYYVLIRVSASIVVRHAHFAKKSIAAVVGQRIVQGETYIGRMGETGAQVRGIHLHTDVFVDGVRVDPEPYFTIPFGQVPEKPKARKRNMTTRFVQIGTGGSNFGVGAICALAGDAGFPGPGNWQEYTRTVADGGVNDRAAREAAVHGPAIPIPKEQWAALRASYTEGAATGSGAGFTSADRQRLNAVPTADQVAKATRAEIIK